MNANHRVITAAVILAAVGAFFVEIALAVGPVKSGSDFAMVKAELVATPPLCESTVDAASRPAWLRDLRC